MTESAPTMFPVDCVVVPLIGQLALSPAAGRMSVRLRMYTCAVPEWQVLYDSAAAESDTVCFSMASIVSQRLLLQQRRRTGQSVCEICRSFSSGAPLFAGHNRWSQIKHDKAKNDKAKSRERQTIAKEISSATQSACLTPSSPEASAC